MAIEWSKQAAIKRSKQAAIKRSKQAAIERSKQAARRKASISTGCVSSMLKIARVFCHLRYLDRDYKQIHTQISLASPIARVSLAKVTLTDSSKSNQPARSR